MGNEKRNNNEGVNNIRDRRAVGPPEYKLQIQDRLILVPLSGPAQLQPVVAAAGRTSYPFGKRRKSTSIF